MAPFAQLARWLAVLGIVVCSSCRCDDAGTASDAGAAVLAPAPAPAGLIAEITSARPEEAWHKLRIALGGSAFFLPKGLGALVSTLVGFPITVASEIDGSSPMWGAVAFDPDVGVVRAVVGLRVLSGERFASQVTIGERAAYRARLDAASGVTLLEATGAETGPGVALGVARDHLLIGRTPDDLLRLGPYVARTLPGRDVPPGDVVVETRAEMGVPLELLAASLERAAGLVPLPGLSRELLAPATFDDLRAVVGDLERVRATWVIDELAGRWRVALSPKAGRGPARQLAAEIAPRGKEPLALADLPQDTVAAWGQRQSPDARAESAAAASAWIDGLSGVGLAESDRRELGETLTAMAKARGDAFVLGVRAGELGPAVFGRTSLADFEAAQAGLSRLWKWLERPAVVAWFGAASLSAEVGDTQVERLPGEIDRVRLRLLDPAKRPPGTEDLPESIDLLLLSRADPGELWIAAGFDSPEALRAVATKPERTIGDVPDVRKLVEEAADQAAVVGYVDLVRLRELGAGRPPRGEAAPLVMAVRSEGETGDLLFELSVARAALPEITRLAHILGAPRP